MELIARFLGPLVQFIESIQRGACVQFHQILGRGMPVDAESFRPRSDIKHTSVYLPEAAYEALRQVAFDERRKIHDLLMEGVELALKKRGYPALAEMKAKHR
jgi:hypothetical protein